MGPAGVGEGGTGVAVGGSGVAVGGAGVAVGGMGVGDGAITSQAARAITVTRLKMMAKVFFLIESLSFA